MKKSAVIFRGALGAALLALTLTTLQILFDVPVAPFLVPGGGAPAGELKAAYDGSVQRVTAQLNTEAYPSIIVQRGIPVEFLLSAGPGSVDDCNERILLPAYGIEQKLTEGENVLRFTPEESGVFEIVCGLGRMKSTVTVVENLGFSAPESTPASESAYTPEPEITVAPEVMEHMWMRGNGQSNIPTPTEDQSPESESEPVSAEESTAPVFEKSEEDVSLGGWLEEQLKPSADTEGVREILTWTGWIFDRDCVGISPVKHTKACNLMGGCYDSGLGIFEYVPGKEFDTYTAVDTFLCFDGASKELAAAFLRALPQDWRNNVTVTVTGYAVNNIPASKDELLVPETDLARVDHYLNGIHITSISAAYIDGVSTNPLPEPNVAFSQP